MLRFRARLSDLRLRASPRLRKNKTVPREEIKAALAPFDQFATAFSDSGENLNGLVSDLTDQAQRVEGTAFRASGIGRAKGIARNGAAISAKRPRSCPGSRSRHRAGETARRDCQLSKPSVPQ